MRLIHPLILMLTLLLATPALAQHDCCGKCDSATVTLTPKQVRQLKKYSPFSILGDSYSTFKGYTTPVDNAQWYPHKGNDVTKPCQTWWELFRKASGLKLDRNNSYSGATVCYTSYNKAIKISSAFVTRATNLGSPRLIIVEGGTNDSWAGSPIGEYKWQDWTEQDLRSFRPAAAKTLWLLKQTYPKAHIVYMLNSQLKEQINSSVVEICRHYDVPLLRLHDIDKQQGHPSYDGMQAICQQLLQYLLFDHR